MARKRGRKRLEGRPGAAIVTFPLRNPDQECGQLYLGMLSRVLVKVAGEVIVVTGNYRVSEQGTAVQLFNVPSPAVRSHSEAVLSKIRRLLQAQLTLSIALLRVASRVDVVIVLFGRGSVVMPTILSKMMGKKIVVVATGSEANSLEQMYPGSLGRIFRRVTLLLEGINHCLADVITVGSPSMIEAMGVGKWRGKVAVGVQLSYLDINRLGIRQGLSQRDCVIGYIGRLSAEKGVLELADAIPLIAKRLRDARFLIVGDGLLRAEMERRVRDASCSDLVQFAGWVPYEKIPEFLNDMKIHVLPSHTEALGGTNLEAMACGTISVVNCVGGLPDVVTDGETGFLLKDNSPATIAATVVDILGRNDLERIQANGRRFVVENFAFDTVVGQWGQILRGLWKERA